MTIDVDYANLHHASEVMSRQGGHLERMRDYVDAQCRLEWTDMGLILQVLLPINEAVVMLGLEVVSKAGELHIRAAGTFDQTVAAYIEADRAAYETAAAWAARIGEDFPPFVDPTGSWPALGGAVRSQSGGGDPEPNLFQQAYEDGAGLHQYVEDEVRRVQDRVGLVGESSRGVVEQSDVTSFLSVPSTEVSEIERMRWSAGPLLGGVDWVFEQLFGFSFLEDVIMKPFAGNWSAIKRSSDAWSNIDGAFVALASNSSGLLPALGSWRGAGSEAAMVAVASIGGGMTALSYAAGYVSGVVGTVATVAKTVAIGIGMILKNLSYKLIRMAAEAAVPVIGWAVAAAETAILIADILGYLRLAYSLVNMLYDAIAGVVEAKAKLVEVAHLVADLVEGLGRAGVARVR